MKWKKKIILRLKKEKWMLINPQFQIKNYHIKNSGYFIRSFFVNYHLYDPIFSGISNSLQNLLDKFVL